MTPAEGAREILKSIEDHYVPTHRFEAVRLEDFRHIDHRFYEAVSRHLAAEGFFHLEDVEDVTLREARGNVLRPVPIRAFASGDGAVMASVYHPKVKSLWLRLLLFVLRQTPGKIIDLETEFTDGSFVVTSNAMSAAAIGSGSLIDVEYHPYKTTLKTLLERHRQRVAQYRSRHDTAPLPVRTASELRASQNRMNALKAAYRGEVGGISLEELKRLSPAAELAEDVHTELRRLQRGEGNDHRAQ